MKAIIIGAGEVGKSLYEVVKDKHSVILRDKDREESGVYVSVMNICFPYFDGFESEVERYKDLYKPVVTIIHSTVPVGTSRKLAAAHSPIHGKHPNLAGGIKTFVKYLGAGEGVDIDLAYIFLKEAGINVKRVSSPEASELSKILCTSYYGWNIIFNKEVKKICDELGVSFEEVYGWNKFYNEGYSRLGMQQFIRPILEFKEGPIGGHCVAQNAKLLDSLITNMIVDKQKEYEVS